VRNIKTRQRGSLRSNRHIRARLTEEPEGKMIEADRFTVASRT
jgi:hypothetical protein